MGPNLSQLFIKVRSSFFYQNVRNDRFITVCKGCDVICFIFFILEKYFYNYKGGSKMGLERDEITGISFFFLLQFVSIPLTHIYANFRKD